MKKLLVLLPVALVMCVPEPFYAESQTPVDEAITQDVVTLSRIVRELRNASDQLANIVGDLKEILGACSDADEAVFLVMNQCNLETTYMSQSYIASKLYWYYCIEERCIVEWRTRTVELLKGAKANTDITIQRLGKGYRGIKKPAALHSIDKARDIMRSTLPLYDKAIQIFESQKL